MSNLELLSHEKLRKGLFSEDLIESLPEIACIFDTAGRLKQWNGNFESVLGYSAQELAKSTALDVIAEEQRGTVQQTIAAVFASGTAKVESVLIAKDGTRIPCLLTGVRMFMDDESCVLGMAVDLRNVRQGEESTLKLAAIVQQSEDAIVSTDLEGTVTSWNSGAERIYGYSAAEALGRHISFCYPPEKTTEAQVFLQKIANGEVIERFDAQRRTKDGGIIDVLLSVSAIKDGAGKIVGTSGIARDVTAHRRVEKELQLQSVALQAAANAIVITDHEGKIVWVNQAFTAMTGYSKEEALGNNSRLLKSGKQPQSFYTDLWSTISSGKVWHGELVNSRKDGTTYTEEMTITPLRLGDGDTTATHFVAVKQDITERKRSEEMLQNNENKYRVLFEDSADANWLMDEKGFLNYNSAALQMFGYSAEAPMLHPADISPPNQPDGTNSRTAAERKIAAAFVNGTERFEWLHQRKNGNVFPAEVCLTALTLSGQPRLLATVRDITERKQAEEALLFKNALLEAQAETTIDGILVVDESDHIVLANKQFGRNFEIPDELLSTRDDLIVRNYAADQMEDSEAFVARVKYLNSHRDEKSRDELRLKNRKTFDRYSAPLVDSKGRYRGRIWYFRDITDRKVAEEQVQF